MSNKKEFKEIPLTLIDPSWGSDLAGIIIELEKLRVKKLGGPVPAYIFFQLKDIFHILESLGSARIEGNNTTLADFVDKIIQDPSNRAKDETWTEIINIDNALDYIETTVTRKTEITRRLISDIHKIITKDLSLPPVGEGSRTPGELRKVPVTIKKSNHVPPDYIKVPDYFDELLSFINTPVDNQYHLLVMAAAHHRMTWIHPFDNGNGRMVRMLTYALLIKQGFQVESGRILNPSAIFCMDREQYYEMLSKADQGTEKGALEWSTYVLKGLLEEIEKIDKLLDIKFVVNSILLPTLDRALEYKHITKREHVILKAIVLHPKMQLKSIDLEKIIGPSSPVKRSRIIGKLREKKMLFPIKKDGRIYSISFSKNHLLRGVIAELEKNNFTPKALENEK